MSSLNSFALTKNDIAKMKLELQNLQKEESNLIKLLNLTQPANLPSLSYSNTNYSTDAHTDMTVMKKIPSETKKIHSSLIRRKKVSKYLFSISFNTIFYYIYIFFIIYTYIFILFTLI